MHWVSKVWCRLNVPLRGAKWVEHPPPSLGDRGIRRSRVWIWTLQFSNPGWVKPITLKLILVTPQPGTQNYWDRTRTAWLSVRIMPLSGIAGHGASGLMFQWGSTIKSPWVCTLTSQHPSPAGLVPQLWSTASYRTRPLVSNSGAIIVTVLWFVPSPTCASSNYKVTRTTHTYIS